MKKTKLFVVAAILLTVFLVGCSNQIVEETQATDSATRTAEFATPEVDSVKQEPFTIGFPFLTNSTEPTVVSIVNNIQTAVEAAGGELIVVNTDFTADGLINNINDLISRGVDGIVFMPAADSMLPTVDQLCTKAGIPYTTIFRNINDVQIKAQILASEYYAGGCYEDDVTCAHNVTKTLAEMGVTNICVINIAKGDSSSDLRDQGIANGAKETGINILNTTYGLFQQTDMTKTVESFIAAYPEMDGIIIAGTYCQGALPILEKSLADHNLSGKVKVGRIDFDSSMGDYLKNGSFHVAYGGQQQIDPLLSSLILVNRVMGTPLADKPSILQVNYLKLTTYEQSQDFLTYFVGNTPVFSTDEIKANLLKAFNPNVDESAFMQTINTFSIDDVASRNKG